MHKIAHMTAAVLAAAACSAQAADVIDLWPEGAPNKSTITAAEETNAQGLHLQRHARPSRSLGSGQSQRQGRHRHSGRRLRQSVDEHH